MKKSKLTVSCFDSDGNEIPVNSKGEFINPVFLPKDIHIKLLNFLNPGKDITWIFESEGDVKND